MRIDLREIEVKKLKLIHLSILILKFPFYMSLSMFERLLHAFTYNN
jgi:hypothetical protein